MYSAIALKQQGQSTIDQATQELHTIGNELNAIGLELDELIKHGALMDSLSM